KKEEIIRGISTFVFEEFDTHNIVDKYGRYAPPPVAGSCPKSSSSAKTLMEFHKDRGYEFDHEGTCAVCNSGPKKLGPCEICEDCVIKMEEEEELIAA
ncbi:MAG: hypothetical protein HYU48_02695, partial [Candidatus Levybacteria bacterium]|nr:hypothetical protein [Candidatus Levybacteria bacterium]